MGRIPDLCSNIQPDKNPCHNKLLIFLYIKIGIYWVRSAMLNNYKDKIAGLLEIIYELHQAAPVSLHRKRFVNSRVSNWL